MASRDCSPSSVHSSLQYDFQSPIKDMEYIISFFESGHGHVASFCVLAELWKVLYIGVYTPLLLFRIQQLPVLKDTGLAC